MWSSFVKTVDNKTRARCQAVIFFTLDPVNTVKLPCLTYRILEISIDYLQPLSKFNMKPFLKV